MYKKKKTGVTTNNIYISRCILNTLSKYWLVNSINFHPIMPRVLIANFTFIRKTIIKIITHPILNFSLCFFFSINNRPFFLIFMSTCPNHHHHPFLLRLLKIIVLIVQKERLDVLLFNMIYADFNHLSYHYELSIY